MLIERIIYCTSGSIASNAGQNFKSYKVYVLQRWYGKYEVGKFDVAVLIISGLLRFPRNTADKNDLFCSQRTSIFSINFLKHRQIFGIIQQNTVLGFFICYREV